MTFLEFIAAVALLINDLLAIFSILGSALMLIEAGINLVRGRNRKAPYQVWMWGWGGFIFGAIGLGSLIITGSKAERIGILGVNRSTIGILLFVSFLLLMASIMLPRITRPK
jgi:hypothetical protein